MKKQVLIFDTTLRDGEQTPGASLNIAQKLEIAAQLAKLKVDVIEAGFPISSPGDTEAVKLISRQTRGPIIAGLARCVKKDVEVCWQSVKQALKPRIHVFVGTSPTHLNMMGKTKDEVVRMTTEAVRLARHYCRDVEFSAMDATRTDYAFLCRVVETALIAGATTINIPDTVGYSIPDEFGGLIHRLQVSLPRLRQVVISVHCHNDLGLATANSLAAVKNGATQIECSINGLGERAGNCALEEVAMAIKTRKDYFGDYEVGVDSTQISATSRLVSRVTGMVVQANKAIVGQNAFAHASGIHQAGLLKNRQTFEIITPESIGLKEHQLILTSRSGRHALNFRLKKMGYRLSAKNLDKAYQQFLALADKKKEVYDDDLLVLLEDEFSKSEETYHLEYLSITSGNQTVPTATVRISRRGKMLQEAACGDGPVDAVYNALDRLTGNTAKLSDYSLKAITGGKDAQGEVSVRLKGKSQEETGRGSSTDIIEASAKAYLNAINKFLSKKKRKGN